MIAIFFRYPVLGAVKKRLAVSVGQEMALSTYKRLLFNTLDIVHSSNFPVTYVVDQWLDTEENLKLVEASIFIQQGNDLGQKMAFALDKLSTEYSKVVLIGSDIPQISVEILNECFIILDHVDYVIGPSLDGGFYLLGIRHWNAKVFDNVPWSVDNTLSVLLNNLEKLSFSYTYTKLLQDIDNYEDLLSSGLLDER